MIVQRLTPMQWALIAEQAYATVFRTKRPATEDRIDYALLVTENETIMGFLTIREWTGNTVHCHFGGAMPPIQRTRRAMKGLFLLLATLRSNGTKTVTCFIENTNTPMLRMALAVGFLITGIKQFQGTTLVEHSLDLS